MGAIVVWATAGEARRGGVGLGVLVKELEAGWYMCMATGHSRMELDEMREEGLCWTG